jgi:O-acetyl-ADP-ribose deacetylase (regulator of RNase III)
VFADVIHTVGPIGENAEKLRQCYWNSLELARENEIKSLAFPCISTGVYGYPPVEAAKVAIEAVREWLMENGKLYQMTSIVFCVFVQSDHDIYEKHLPQMMIPA